MVREGTLDVRRRKPPAAPVSPTKAPGPRMLLARRLNASDLGWFASARRRNLAAGRQRGINLQAALVQAFLTPAELKAGKVEVLCSRVGGDGTPPIRAAPRPSRNWLLRGEQVDGPEFEQILTGDWLFLEWRRDGEGRLHLVWEAVLRATRPEAHSRLEEILEPLLEDGTSRILEETADRLAAAVPELRSVLGVTPPPPRTPPRQARTVQQRIQDPHILVQLVGHGATLSAGVQADYLDKLQVVAVKLREVLHDADMILRMEVDHPRTWAAVRGLPLTFIDGGVGAIQALGAEPIAIRVGSYTVRPGDTSDHREEFRFEHMLVDELYEGTLYEEGFDDLHKLRDAARISLETSAILQILERTPRPAAIFVHGPLVNPISPYALEGFPNFVEERQARLLPGLDPPRKGRDANFVSIHREQLSRIAASGVPTVGVVERSSISTITGRAVLERLVDGHYMDASSASETQESLRPYRPTHSLLFELVLDPGEYLVPMAIDKNTASKIPNEWRDEIERYPHPLVTWLKATATSLPVRLEFPPADMPAGDLDRVLGLVLHMCRILPRYAFPVGLDIVDRFAKVPAWMSRRMSNVFASQAMLRAMESGNPQIIAMARRYLSGNSRDWLFRPTL